MRAPVIPGLRTAPAKPVLLQHHGRAPRAVKAAMLRMNEAAATTARLNVWSRCSSIAERQGQSARYALDVRSCLHSFYGLPELHFVISHDLRRNMARAGCLQRLPELHALAVLTVACSSLSHLCSQGMAHAAAAAAWPWPGTGGAADNAGAGWWQQAGDCGLSCLL